MLTGDQRMLREVGRTTPILALEHRRRLPQRQLPLHTRQGHSPGCPQEYPTHLHHPERLTGPGQAKNVIEEGTGC